MVYRVDRGEDYAVVCLDGDVDLSTSPKARKLILDALKHDPAVLVDLTAVNYIDSSGVANLVEGYQVARQHDRVFALAVHEGPVLNVLKLARLDTVFEVHPSTGHWLEKRSSATK